LGGGGCGVETDVWSIKGNERQSPWIFVDGSGPFWKKNRNFQGQQDTRVEKVVRGEKF